MNRRHESPRVYARCKGGSMILTYTVAYLMSYLLASLHLYTASAAVLMAESMVLYCYERKKTGHIVSAAGLYSLSLVGGEGISCMKLSYLQTDWENMTWLCFFVAYMAFRLGIFLDESGYLKHIFNGNGRKRTKEGRIFSRKRFLVMNCLLATAAWICFCLEAAILGFIPLMVRGVPHAYSAFHISGVHYLTVSCVLCPALSVIWYMGDIEHKAAETAAAAAAGISGFLIPILCVSRFQLVFALMLAVSVWAVIKERRSRIERKTLAVMAALCLLALVPAYIVLTRARSHDAQYLMSVFEMKKDYPVVLSQFYIYIANNFDNFNCMVKNLTEHTFGRRQLFPLWALTGLKFVFPQLTIYEYFITKKELTTLTLFYDTYYDCGIVGVAVFALVLGIVANRLEKRAFQKGDARSIMLYGQFAIYMALAFFTTWFSNPTTWFYIAVTFAVCAFALKKGPLSDAGEDLGSSETR